ncbi:hypothetical protein GSI_13160 [Ganoderma sinense ZZ0214-1]|uniref:Uncharacterized protein n=1 Tax=Ganoderma sinense ZZ0214-1 TaxID=1077348 RepID=A0A2G8RUT5_9APHY|nr:hypothetical protein GSI_13160 [Ganoderma sinense ZZ0214-1]
MNFEDTLPQKQQLPRAYRKCVGNDMKARSHCPINGTRPFNLVDWSPSQQNRLGHLRQRDHKQKRKAQQDVHRAAARHEDQVAGSGKQGTRREAGSLPGGTQPTIVRSPTILPYAQYCHSWSIHDPAAAPESVDLHSATTASARIVPRQPSCPPPASTIAREQRVALAYDPVHIQPPMGQRAVTASPRPRPELTYITGEASTAQFATVSLDLENSYSFSASSATSPPSVWSENPRVSAATPSAHVAPEHKPAHPLAQGSIWSEDAFIKAYQAFFLPRRIDNPDSKGPAPGPRPTPRDSPNMTTRQANGGLEPDTYATTPTVTDSVVPTTGSRSGTDEQRPHDASSTQLRGNDYLDWSIPPAMVVEPIDPQRFEELEAAAAAGYEHTLYLQAILPSTLPEAIYMDMHSSPLVRQTSHSEPAGALECSPKCSLSVPTATHHRGPTWVQTRHTAPANSF